MNSSTRRDSRGESQSYAVLAELDGNHGNAAAARAYTRKRKFPAGQKACRLAILRDEIRLGENLQKPLYFQRFNGGSEVQVGAEEEEIERIRQCRHDRAERRDGWARKLLGAHGYNCISRAGAEYIQPQGCRNTSIHARKLDPQQNLRLRRRYVHIQKVYGLSQRRGD